MKRVTIYTASYCPYCRRAEALLKTKDVELIRIDVEVNPQALEEVKGKTGWNTIPQIYIGDRFIGGCDDMMELERNGNLDELLKG